VEHDREEGERQLASLHVQEDCEAFGHVPTPGTGCLNGPS
jgi:hypothetical protein